MEDGYNRSNFMKLIIPIICNYCCLAKTCQEYNMNTATAAPHWRTTNQTNSDDDIEETNFGKSQISQS
jgi:hypothetical protein